MRRHSTRVMALAAALLMTTTMVCAGDGVMAQDTDTGLVRIERVEVHGSLVGPVVLLIAQNRAIPIFVDAVVATSIQSALSGEKLARPLTHDLMRSILEGFDGTVSRVVIMLKEQTYYADLSVLVAGKTKVFDSRSSDAIALATHFKAPMLVPRELLDRVGAELDGAEPKTPKGVAL